MKTMETVGIDVSKLTLDVHLHVNRVHSSFSNSGKGFKSMLTWVGAQTALQASQLLICFEHTGLYSLPLATFLSERSINFCMVAGLEVKKSLGIQRGKNDKVDAARIAEYAHMRASRLKPYRLPSKTILQLQQLLQLRAQMVKNRAGYKASLKEHRAMLKRKDNEAWFATHEALINQFDKQILKTEAQMKQIIDADPQIKQVYALVTSVIGVGFVLGCSFIITTNCFTSFENSRQYACYSGIAPFKQQSGTSLNSKSRVSHYANKNMKSLLDRGALSNLRHDPESRLYYQRRLDEGKSKRSTINIIRNKIVSRVFAVVRRGTPYVKLYKHAA